MTEPANERPDAAQPPIGAAGKTYTLSKPNGIFVCLLDYEGEDDLFGVIAMLNERLGTSFPQPDHHPYSSSSVSELEGKPLVAMFHPDTGCCLLFESGNEALAARTVSRLYPSS